MDRLYKTVSKTEGIEYLDVAQKGSFYFFVRRAWDEIEPSPFVDNWHIECICEHLQAVYEGKIKRLMILVPPRTLKTFIANICFTAWVLGRDPGKKIIGVSYSQRLSEKISFRSRILMESNYYRRLFSGSSLDVDQTQKANFMTTKGGGRFSTSVGGTLTGEGGNILIFDDPMNPDEALSDVKREASNEWVDQAAFSRLNNPKEDSIICIMQRLHVEDTAAHLMEKDDWLILKFPAETNETIEIQLGDKKWSYAGFLHEERMGREVLNQFKRSMGAYAYSAQYLQDPTPKSGGEFNSDLFNYFRTSDFDATRCNLYITVDPATSKKKESDYTAMAVWALAPDQNYYLIDGIKEKLNPTERVNRLFDLHRKWNARTKKPPRVGWEEYALSSDIHYIEKRQSQDSYRFPVIKIASKMKKEERIRRLIAPMETGQIWLPNDLWKKDDKGLSRSFINDIIEQEMLLFPYAPHDDFIDAMSRIFDMDPIFPRVAHIDVSRDYLENRGEPLSVYDL